MQKYIHNFPNKFWLPHPCGTPLPLQLEATESKDRDLISLTVYFGKHSQAWGSGCPIRLQPSRQMLSTRTNRVNSPVSTPGSPPNPMQTRKVPRIPQNISQGLLFPHAGTKLLPNSDSQPELSGLSDPGGRAALVPRAHPAAGGDPGLSGRGLSWGSHAIPAGPGPLPGRGALQGLPPAKVRAHSCRALGSRSREAGDSDTPSVELCKLTLAATPHLPPPPLHWLQEQPLSPRRPMSRGIRPQVLLHWRGLQHPQVGPGSGRRRCAGGAGARANVKQKNKLRPRGRTGSQRPRALPVFKGEVSKLSDSRNYEFRLGKNLVVAVFCVEEAEFPRSRELLKYGFKGDTTKYPISPDGCSSVAHPSLGKPEGP